MKFNDVTITKETINNTRQWFIDIKKACIVQATAGEFFVKDLKEYVDWCNLMIEEIQNGNYDNSLTFAQMAYFIQTGESVPFFKSSNIKGE